jgi:bifunctional DNA-binding transcriptional regulator/antitoxin component of YhaV-PrlF toxin-antitoxin module
MNLTKRRNTYLMSHMFRTKISSKGQTTIPKRLLKIWKTSRVLWDVYPDGSARVYPTPDIMSLRGSAAGSKSYDPAEKTRAREAMGRQAAQEGSKK